MRICALLALAGASSLAVANPDLEVIFTSIPGSPTSLIPGGGGERFRSPLASMLDLYASPSGNAWVFKGFSNNADLDVIMTGSGTSPILAAKEGDAIPGTAFSYGFMDSDCAVNDNGIVAFGNRLAGATTGTDEVLVRWSPGAGAFIVVQEGSAAPNLIDAPGQISGDETFGNSLNSPVILADGTIAFRADLINNLATDRDAALFSGSAVLQQQATPLLGQIFDAPVASTLRVTADGLHWMAEVDADPGLLVTTEALLLDGTIVVRDGDVLTPASFIVDAIFDNDLRPDLSWTARGDFVGDADWCMRNGVVAFITGDALQTALGTEHVGDAVSVFRASTSGDTLLVCNTDNPDPGLDTVMMLNDDVELAREGDAVDVDDNGVFDDDAFIAGFGANDAAFGDDGYVYFLCTLRNGVGTGLGSAFLRVPIGPVGGCPADLTTGAVPGQPGYGVPNGVLNNDDFFYYLAQFAAGNIAVADLTTGAVPGQPGYGVPNGILNNDDFFYYLAIFAAGC